MFKNSVAHSGRLFRRVVLSLLIAVPAAQADLVINEIMYYSGSGIPEQTDEEYIELLNTGEDTINLLDFELDRGVKFTFPNVTINPGAYLVVAANPATFATKYPGVGNVVGPWQGKLSNSGERIRVIDNIGNTLDSVEYSDQGDWANRVRGRVDNGHRGWSWDTSADGAGSSLELINPALSNNAGHNWLPSSVNNGTPGTANSVASNDIAPLIRKVEHKPALPTTADMVVVEADITDEQPGATATLHWRIATQSPSAFATLPMTAPTEPGDDKFTAEIGAHSQGTIIEFYIEASDGTLARTWPAATDDGQSANALFQFDDLEYTGSQGIYRLIMTPTEDQEFTNIDRDSDAQMNTTLIANDGTGPIVRYRCGTRVRGASSRRDNPVPLRVNIPRDDPWNGYTRMNLNTQFTSLQFIGMKLLQSAGLAAPDTKAVQVRRNGSDGATNDEEQYGSYVHVEPLGGEFVDDKFPDDDGGNLYKKVRPDNDWAYRNGNSLAYESDGWSKSNNSSANDWSDLDELLRVMNTASGDPDYIEQVEAIADLDQWMRWFAAMTIIANGETNASNGADDDYSMYSSGIDRRFKFVPHDLDTILGLGDNSRNTNPQHTLFDMIGNGDVLGPLVPLFQDPTIRARYFLALRELIQTSFSKDRFDTLLNSHLGDWVPSGTILSMISFMDARRTYIAATIDAELGPPPPLTDPTTVGELTSAHGDLMISEILAINQSAFANGASFPDVIELHNGGPNPIDLAGMAITDDAAIPDKFIFLAGTVIPAGGYLNLFAASQTADPGIHLGFGLDGEGDSLHLFPNASGGTPIDSIVFGNQIPDQSIGRTGPALETWHLTAPTIGAANSSAGNYGSPSLLRINEWLASPEVRFENEFIELFNPDSLPVALGLMTITDNAVTSPDPHTLPELSFIAAGGFLVFEGLGDDALAEKPEQLPFKIKAHYDWIAIAGSNGIEIDKIHLNNQVTDRSRGRLPDGAASDARLSFPTPGLTNNHQPSTTITEVVPYDSIWAYEDTNTDFSATPWTEPAPTFDDSAWPRGQALLGFDNDGAPFPILTRLDLNPPTTHYFRHSFTLTAAQAAGPLFYESIIDDGAVLYINGNELPRLNMTSGFIDHNTLATRTHEASIEGPDPLSSNFVTEGENLFAVEVHQRGNNSSDVVFGMRITSVTATSSDPEFARAIELLDGLRVTEIMYAPPGGKTHEFIELQNIGPVPLGLEGVRFTDGIGYTFPAMSLAPGAFVVIVRDQTAFIAEYGPGAQLAPGTYTGALNNAGEHVRLTLPEPFGAAILSFDYNNSWLPSTDGNGRSLTIKDSLGTPRTWDKRSAWIASSVDGGSPGSKGPPTITSPLIISGTQGFSFNYQITAANDPISFSAVGLPSGLSIDTDIGLISGNPAVAGVFEILIGANSLVDSDSKTLTLTIDPQPAPEITSRLTASASPSANFSYQITASNLPSSFGATGLPAWLNFDSTTGILSGVADAESDYMITISATNFGGTGTETLTLSVITNALAVALDSNGILEPVERGEPVESNIAGWKNQSVYTHDGIDAAESPSISDNEHAWLEATITGPDTLSFFWKVSSQQDNGYMVFWMGGTPLFITGEVDWEERVVEIPAGEHFIQWEYGKYGVGDDSPGLDRGWLDEVYLESASPLPRINSRLTAYAISNSPFEYQITATRNPTSFDASPLPAGLSVDPNTGLISGTPTELGRTEVTISATNAEGTGSAIMRLDVISTLVEAFDNLGLFWEYNGDAEWFEQNNVTHDGIDAAVNGDIGDSQSSSLSTNVTGPAMLSFWWKVSSESCCDPLTFTIDGGSPIAILGEIDWERRTVEIPEGNHTIRWEYSKDGSVSDGDDSAWVDEIVIEFDSDNDGLDDNWELSHFGNLDQSGSNDTDGDGFDNASEQAADTDPTDENSFFNIIFIGRNADGSTQLTWKSSGRRSYILQTSTDLANAWTTVGDVIPGQQGETSFRIIPPGSTAVEQILVPENAALRATVPASEIGTLWRGGDEDAFAAEGGDSGWRTGLRGIGYETSGNGNFDDFFGTDVLDLMRNINTSAYMRIRFPVAEPTYVTELLLQVRVDDAFVAFINGAEVARSPAAPASLFYRSEADSAPNDDTDFQDFDISGFIGALQAGENILAIHGLNRGLSSSDFLIVPKITADVIDPSNAPQESALFLRVLVVE